MFFSPFSFSSCQSSWSKNICPFMHKLHFVSLGFSIFHCILLYCKSKTKMVNHAIFTINMKVRSKDWRFKLKFHIDTLTRTQKQEEGILHNLRTSPEGELTGSLWLPGQELTTNMTLKPERVLCVVPKARGHWVFSEQRKVQLEKGPLPLKTDNGMATLHPPSHCTSWRGKAI